MCICTPERAGFNTFLDPLTFPDEEEPNWKGRRFVFEDEVGQQRAFKVNGNILFLAHEFQGRRTFVASVEPVNEKGKALPPLVLKFQWPGRNSPATEDSTIRKLIYTFLASISLSKPTAIMEYRDLLVTVSRRCQGLHKVKNLKEFKQVFIGIVEFTTVLSHKGKFCIEISAKGMSCFIEMKKAQLRRYRIELVEAAYRHSHFYRHDLESFLYLLIWAGVHFDLNAGVCLDTSPTLAGWNARYSYKFESARGKKSLFWQRQAVAEGILETFQPAFDLLKDERIRPLRVLFNKGFRLAEDAEDSKRQGDFDGKTLGGIVTFESFMEVLGQKPQNWFL
ncbi:hypothetical protein EV421DRAFT_1924984 [Armillaria borealis]|uniref:Fungal-type protein kinase domain-containing protein n=1 Tax=Armillaria borealis TaxID=47425 RepID=A0AA39MFK8_9AGAR|nr:hypothetical protein EV421DRAFT_1924984 [Armillaria borealis]